MFPPPASQWFPPFLSRPPASQGFLQSTASSLALGSDRLGGQNRPVGQCGLIKSSIFFGKKIRKLMRPLAPQFSDVFLVSLDVYVKHCPPQPIHEHLPLFPSAFHDSHTTAGLRCSSSCLRWFYGVPFISPAYRAVAAVVRILVREDLSSPQHGFIGSSSQQTFKPSGTGPTTPPTPAAAPTASLLASQLVTAPTRLEFGLLAAGCVSAL